MVIQVLGFSSENLQLYTSKITSKDPQPRSTKPKRDHAFSQLRPTPPPPSAASPGCWGHRCA